MLNALTCIICGVLWKELSFALLLFCGIFILRPYAGGYHADTKLRCFLISVILINLVIWIKKMIFFSIFSMTVLYGSTAIFIWLHTPAENPGHCLSEEERNKYKKNARMILICNALIILAGIYIQKPILKDAVIWTQILTVIAMVMGIWKYKSRHLLL